MMLIGAVVVLLILVPPLFFDLFFNTTVRRLGLRNASRRPGEAALVIAGSMLATALITASFLIGDSFGSSVRSQADTLYGPIDQFVNVSDTEAAAAAISAADTNGNILDGVLEAQIGEVVVGGEGESPIVLGSVRLMEVEPRAAFNFGGDNLATGLSGIPSKLKATEVVINQRIADSLRVKVGSEIKLYLEDEVLPLTVVTVLDRYGLAGYGELIVQPGTVSARPTSSPATEGSVLVSNVGDNQEGEKLTSDATNVIKAALGQNTDVNPVKKNLLAEATADSDEMTELFGTVGGFSVVAGILLLVNLFAMLAGERRQELGTMSALGLNRSKVRRAFSLEGFIYGIIAAIAGAGLGIAVAAGVMQFAAESFNDDSDLTLALAVELPSLVAGAAIGLAISQLTVTLTSSNIARVNIVNALKGISTRVSKKPSRSMRYLGLAGALCALGVLWFFDTEPIVVIAFPVLALLLLIPVVAALIGFRIAAFVLGTAALIYTATVFSTASTTLKDPELPLFLLQGVLMVGLAVVLLGSLNNLWTAALKRLRTGSPALRLGLANPLDRPFRSGLLVAMFSLVIFTVTFTAVLNTVFQQQVPDFAREVGGTFDAVVDSNSANPLSTDEILARSDVKLAVPIPQGEVEYTYVDAGDGQTYEDFWEASVVSTDFPADRGPKLATRDSQYSSDAKAWEALKSAKDLVVVPKDSGFLPGQVLTLFSEESTIDVTVIGTTKLEWAIGAGFYVPESLTLWLGDDTKIITRHYVVGADGVDPDSLAKAVADQNLTNGTQATSFLAVAQADVDEQQAFIRLLQGYLGLGLLIGIAGLGVVLIRSVRERRQQLGMMSAIGVKASVVQRMFFVEALFIAAQGVALGIGLGLLSAWLVLTRSTAFEENLTFAIPTPGLAALAGIALFAALLSGLIPARRAGRIPPAVALRVTG